MEKTYDDNIIREALRFMDVVSVRYSKRDIVITFKYKKGKEGNIYNMLTYTSLKIKSFQSQRI